MMRRYPDANGCTRQEKHILTPWSALLETGDYRGEKYAIQWAECCRCGYVMHNIVPGQYKQVGEAIRRATAVHRVQRELAAGWRDRIDEEHPRGTEKPPGD